jgi:hypothetical protein
MPHGRFQVTLRKGRRVCPIRTNCLDDPLGAPTIPSGSTRCSHEPLERLITDKLLRPQGVEEFLTGDHPVTVLDAGDEQIEDFGLEL